MIILFCPICGSYIGDLGDLSLCVPFYALRSGYWLICEHMSALSYLPDIYADMSEFACYGWDVLVPAGVRGYGSP